VDSVVVAWVALEVCLVRWAWAVRRGHLVRFQGPRGLEQHLGLLALLGQPPVLLLRRLRLLQHHVVELLVIKQTLYQILFLDVCLILTLLKNYVM
jgi:hypothetical protein